MSIFISIASFCDPVLEFTLQQALLKAKNPESIFFGIIEQNHAEKALKNIPANVRYVLIDPVQSKGACWARSLAMTLYNDEDWFFQIDSHTYFDQDWDEKMVNEMSLLYTKSRNNLIISSYPNAFIIEGGVPIKQPATNGALVHVVKKDLTFNQNNHVLSFEAHPFDTTESVKGFQLGAGCIFANSTYVQKFPYDPYLYFAGEEQTLSARLYTHGWDIYHMPAMPVYHLYNHKDNKQPTRQLHWDAEIEIKRNTTWSKLENRSSKRISSLYNNDHSLGIYGLGSVRSLSDYAELSGINYVTKQIDAKAYISCKR